MPEYEFDMTRTADQVCSVEPESGKVYVFVEPFPALLKVMTQGAPDECDGARCVSFILDGELGELAYQQSMALTRGVVEAERRGEFNGPSAN